MLAILIHHTFGGILLLKNRPPPRGYISTCVQSEVFAEKTFLICSTPLTFFSAGLCESLRLCDNLLRKP
jgi:hypothetical protein